jgi:hypothetical protein
VNFHHQGQSLDAVLGFGGKALVFAPRIIKHSEFQVTFRCQKDHLRGFVDHGFNSVANPMIGTFASSFTDFQKNRSSRVISNAGAPMLKFDYADQF